MLLPTYAPDIRSSASSAHCVRPRQFARSRRRPTCRSGVRGRHPDPVAGEHDRHRQLDFRYDRSRGILHRSTSRDVSIATTTINQWPFCLPHSYTTQS